MKKEEVKDKLEEKFSSLQFDAEKHIYEHEGKRLQSVSSLIKEYVEPFDAEKISYYVAKSRGISQQEVLDEWEEKKQIAIAKGNKAHDFGENYKPGVSIPTTGQERAIMRFWDNIPNHIKPVSQELRMFSQEFGIAGTADVILYNEKTDSFIIVDYKTNNDLFKNHKGKTMLEPFGFLIDCPFNKYQLQLSYYQILLEQVGIKVERRRLVWLKPDGNYKIHDAEDFTDILRKELKKRNQYANW